MLQADDWIVLHGLESSLVLEVLPGEAPLWRYWGPRLPDDVIPPAPLRSSRPTPSFSPDFDQPFGLVPGLGQGWFGEPGLKAHRAGRDWTFQTTGCAVERVGQSAVVTLTDAVAKIALAVSLAFDPVSDVLTISAKLANTTVVASLKKLGFVTVEDLELLRSEVQELSERLDNLTSEVRAASNNGAREKKRARPPEDEI